MIGGAWWAGWGGVKRKCLGLMAVFFACLPLLRATTYYASTPVMLSHQRHQRPPQTGHALASVLGNFSEAAKVRGGAGVRGLGYRGYGREGVRGEGV